MKKTPNFDTSSPTQAPGEADPQGVQHSQPPYKGDPAEKTGLDSATEQETDLSGKETGRQSKTAVAPRAATSRQVHGPPTPDVLSNVPDKERASLDEQLKKGASKHEELVWLGGMLAKPNDTDMASMVKWTKKTLAEAQIEEHGYVWMEKVRPLLHKLNTVAGRRDALRMKRTIMLLVAADYMNQPRTTVYNMDYTATRQGFIRWMKEPKVFAIYSEIKAVMEDEVLEHEFEAIRHATRVTRMSAGRAAEVRRDLLEHDNPWVALQAARDISQTADRATASKGSQSTSISISASLSDTQVQQLLERATAELRGWNDIVPDNAGLPDGRPLVIVEQAPEPEPHTPPVQDSESQDASPE